MKSESWIVSYVAACIDCAWRTNDVKKGEKQAKEHAKNISILLA